MFFRCVLGKLNIEGVRGVGGLPGEGEGEKKLELGLPGEGEGEGLPGEGEGEGLPGEGEGDNGEEEKKLEEELRDLPEEVKEEETIGDGEDSTEIKEDAEAV